MMTAKLMQEIIEEKLDPKRCQHTVRVAETAVLLAERFGADIGKVKTAAYFHDIAKNMADRELEEMLTGTPDASYLKFSPKVWHAPAGAILAQGQYQITDPDILAAIKNHCTGRPNMGLTEEIVFLADYMEPGRTQPGVDEVRKLAETSLKGAISKVLADTVAYLEKKAAGIHPDTLAAYRFYR